MTHNTAAIRNLLKATFDDQELIDFCFDYFREVYEKFALGMGRLVKIQLLIEYCEKQDEFDKLLSLIKEINPRQYNNFSSLIKKPLFISSTEINSSTSSLVDIKIKGDLFKFSPELRYATVGALAGILDVPRDRIRILEAWEGSIVLRLEMPIQAARWLITLYEANDPILEDLGIQQVQLINKNLHNVSVIQDLQHTGVKTYNGYFDPYSLSLSILSTLTSIKSSTYQLQDKQLANRENHIKRQLYQLVQVIYENVNLLTQFRNFLKENNVLQEKFQLWTIEIPLEKEDLVKIEQIYSNAFRIGRILPKILNDLIPLLTIDENNQFNQMLANVKTILKEAVIASSYENLLFSFKISLEHVFEFAYYIGTVYESDKLKFAKIFKSSSIFEDWEDVELASKPTRQIPIVNGISTGFGVIGEEDIYGYLPFMTQEYEDVDFGIIISDDSMSGDDIAPGDIALISQQPTVNNGEIAAIIITTSQIKDLAVLKRYYVVNTNKGLAHWLLESSNPSREHLVVIPSGADAKAIREFYIQKIEAGKIHNQPIFYEDAELTIAGKFVGLVKKSSIEQSTRDSFITQSDTMISVISRRRHWSQ